MFNLKLKIKSYRAHDIFKSLVQALFKETQQGEWTKLMLEKKYKSVPILPEVNKKSWEFAFVQYLLENVSVQKDLIAFTKKLEVGMSIKDMKYKKYFPGKKWQDDKINILEFLQSNKMILLEYSDNGIIKIKKVNKKSLRLPSIFDNLMKG